MVLRRYFIKSDNEWAAIQGGGQTSWVHIDAGKTGRTTIKRSTKTGAALILCNVVVNTTGTTNPSVITDSGAGVIASIKASVNEKDFHYNIPLQGDLIIDNTGGADLTVVYVTP